MTDTERPSSSHHIRWDESGRPHSDKFDDVYFSKESGVEESRYVFLEGNKLSERWSHQDTPKNHFSIFETGFGTGLNFLSAWHLWRSKPLSRKANLHFLSVEKYPLSASDLRRALSIWPELNELSDQLVKHYPPQPTKGMHRIVFEGGKIVLTLFFGDARDGLSEWLPIAAPGESVKGMPVSFGGNIPFADAWFLDGFTPAKNPDLWTQEIFDLIAQLSQENTSFATFTAAGHVRRGLTDAGFICSKQKGFGRKREMLSGVFNLHKEEFFEACESKRDEKQQTTEQRYNVAPGKEQSWHLRYVEADEDVKHVCIIGGGLAGCHSAFALANKNVQVTVLEKSKFLASGASGNAQGAVYGKLSPHTDPLSQLNLTAQIFANHFYANHGFFESCGQQCGVLHLAHNDRLTEHYTAIAKQYHDFEAPTTNENASFAKWIDKLQTEETCGLPLNNSGLFIAQAGWLNPAVLCQQLTQHKNINIETNAHVETLAFENGTWKIFGYDGKQLAQVDAVIIANAFDALRLEQSKFLPLKRIRGQVSYLPATSTTEKLKSVICGDGYIAPKQDQLHTIGATFTLKNFSESTNTEDHAANVEKLRALSQAIANDHDIALPVELSGRVGFRCTTPDYFPVVGPLPSVKPFVERFSKLRRNANTVVDSPGSYLPRLYCNLGHGSRGLCYMPLCSETLASVITGEFLPISRSLWRYLHPARFLVRDLARRKI